MTRHRQTDSRRIDIEQALRHGRRLRSFAAHELFAQLAGQARRLFQRDDGNDDRCCPKIVACHNKPGA